MTSFQPTEAGRVGGQEMHALGNHVVGQDQVADHRRVVVQPARGRMGGDATAAGR